MSIAYLKFHIFKVSSVVSFPGKRISLRLSNKWFHNIVKSAGDKSI